MPTPPPLEHKSAPTMLEPPPVRDGRPAAPATGVTEVDPDTGTVTALVAVTGVRDDVGDIIVPGAFRRTLRERTPRMVVGHDWGRIAGKALQVIELLPGDRRLPRTAPDGTPWPREAGALWVKARFLMGTVEGREQYEIAKAFGPSQGFSIGYRVTPDGAKVRGGTRHISDLDCYEFSPVLHGANRYATQLGVKVAGGAVEYKATTASLRSVLAGDATCGSCGRLSPGGPGRVPAGATWLCPACTDALGDLIADLDALANDDPEQGDGPAGRYDDGAPSLADLDGFDHDEDQALDEDGWGDQDSGPPVAAGRRHLLQRAVCAICGGTAGGTIGGAPTDRDTICPTCVAEIGDLADDLTATAATDRAELSVEEMDAAGMLSSGDEYDEALTDQVQWDLAPDGTLVRPARADRRGRAWRPSGEKPRR